MQNKFDVLITWNHCNQQRKHWPKSWNSRKPPRNPYEKPKCACIIVITETQTWAETSETWKKGIIKRRKREKKEPVILWEKSSHQSNGLSWEASTTDTFWSTFFSSLFFLFNPLMGPIGIRYEARKQESSNESRVKTSKLMIIIININKNRPTQQAGKI